MAPAALHSGVHYGSRSGRGAARSGASEEGTPTGVSRRLIRDKSRKLGRDRDWLRPERPDGSRHRSCGGVFGPGSGGGERIGWRGEDTAPDASWLSTRRLFGDSSASGQFGGTA